MLVCAVVFPIFRLHRTMWRFTALNDVLRIAQAVVVADLLRACRSCSSPTGWSAFRRPPAPWSPRPLDRRRPRRGRGADARPGCTATSARPSASENRAAPARRGGRLARRRRRLPDRPAPQPPASGVRMVGIVGLNGAATAAPSTAPRCWAAWPRSAAILESLARDRRASPPQVILAEPRPEPRPARNRGRRRRRDRRPGLRIRRQPSASGPPSPRSRPPTCSTVRRARSTPSRARGPDRGQAGAGHRRRRHHRLELVAPGPAARPRPADPGSTPRVQPLRPGPRPARGRRPKVWTACLLDVRDRAALQAPCSSASGPTWSCTPPP